MEIFESIITVLEVALAIITSLVSLLLIVRNAVKGGSREEVMRILKAFCEEAEELWGSKMGDTKFAEVASRFFQSLPLKFQIAYSLKDVEKMIREIIEKYDIHTEDESEE